MMTKTWIYHDGKQILVPENKSDAIQWGWHHGLEFECPLYYNQSLYEAIHKWCEETIAPQTYKIFLWNMWFLREQDAVLCRLKWS